MGAVACLLFCMLLAGPFAAVHAQKQQDDTEQHPGSNVVLAAELVRIASRLAAAAAARNGAGYRHHRRPPAAVEQHTERAAVQNIKKGLVQSVPVAFKGHNLTVVALSHE